MLQCLNDAQWCYVWIICYMNKHFIMNIYDIWN